MPPLPCLQKMILALFLMSMACGCADRAAPKIVAIPAEPAGTGAKSPQDESPIADEPAPAASNGLSSGPQRFGVLTGQFVYDGPPPPPRILVERGDSMAKDAAVCAARGIPDESLVVDPETRGIANVVIWMRSARPATVEPSETREPVVSRVENCQFVPHVLLARTNQPIHLHTEAEKISHNPHPKPANPKNSRRVPFLPPREGPMIFEFPASERQPIFVKCDIHPWMMAYWMIVDHSFAAITDREGRFRIDAVPEGKHTFAFWHERGFLEREFEVTIDADQTTDLGPRRIDPARFDPARFDR